MTNSSIKIDLAARKELNAIIILFKDKKHDEQVCSMLDQWSETYADYLENQPHDGDVVSTIEEMTTVIKKTAMEEMATTLININYKNTINFIDVGSFGGLPAPWDTYAETINYLVNFEPNDDPGFSNNQITFDVGLWEKDEVRPFYICKGLDGQGDSLFKQNMEYVRENFHSLKNLGDPMLAETWFERSEIVGSRSIQCRSLDSLFEEELSNRKFHFMKVDSQGAEYNILKGAQNFLSTNGVGLHLELFTLPLYEGIMLLPDVEEYLLQFGFRLVKKFPEFGTFDAMQDCLFINETRDKKICSILHEIYRI